MSDDSLDKFSLAGVQRPSLLSLQVPESSIPAHQLVVVLHPACSVVRLDARRSAVQLLVNVSVVAVLQQEVTAQNQSGQGGVSDC